MIAQSNPALPKILTSSWYTRIPADHIRIGISRGTPRGLPAGYKLFKTLAPGDWFKTVNPDVYREKFFAEILAPLDAITIVRKVVELAGPRVPVLCCYEHPEKDADWCHRGYVSAWLKDAIDLDVFEFGHEDRGCGWSHPKLPAAHREKPAVDGPAKLI